MFKQWLPHPLTRGLDIDDPDVTHLRKQIVKEKDFLCSIYKEWYHLLATSLPPGREPVLELGSGAGFLQTYIPELITSEVFVCPDISLVLDGQQLPFADATLRAIVMTDVLHHIPQVHLFLAEAARCVMPGGGIVMIEPWVTPWSTLIYRHLHHEPFQPNAPEWEFPVSGPLSGANGALPWMLFSRDYERFVQEFPTWQIQTIEPIMPFRYLLSGGVSMRSLMPGWSFRWWQAIEYMLRPWRNQLGMFAYIVLRRTERKVLPL